MLIKKFVVCATVVTFAFGAISMPAQDADALLNLLIRKGLITPKDAAEVRAEMAKGAKSKSASAATTSTVPVTTNSAEKWKLSSPIVELELFGDARLRYDNRQGEDVNHDTQQRSRERYRLRLGLHGTLADDWFFGIRLETSQNPRSSNVTIADDTSGSSAGGGGPFAKGGDGINVGQAYLGYKGFQDITLTAGRMPNPLVTTLMLWDPDINPEGLAEQWKHTFKFGGEGGETTASFSKDGMRAPATTTKSESVNLKIDVFVNFAQFVYDDANPENPIGPSPQRIPNTDAFLLAWQAGAKFSFPNTLYAQIAPTLYNYTGAGDTFNTSFNGDAGGNQTGVNNLLVFDLPVEVGWTLGEIPMRFFADFAVNLNGDDRAEAAGHPGKGDQRYAYQIGVGLGQLKKKNDWQLNVFWQRQDQFSLDPNLVDTEFFDSKLNLEGVGVTVGYMLSDAVFVQLLYAYAWHADDGLGTGGGGDIGINPVDKFQLFQADLNVRF